MLKQLRKKLTKLVAQRKERSDVARLRPLLERLEDRAMLSASFGHMSQGQGRPDFARHVGGSGPPATDSAVYSLGSPHATNDDFQNSRGGKDPGTSSSRPERSLMQQSLGPRTEMRSLDQQWAAYPERNQYVASPPPTQSFNSFTQPTFRSSNSTSKPQNLPLLIPELPHSDPPLASNVWNPPLGTPLGTPRPSSITHWIIVINEPSPNQTATARSQNPGLPSGSNLLDTTFNRIPSATGVLAFASTLTDLSAVQQMIARDSSSVAALSAVARELAFQDYTPQLLIMAASTSYDRASVNSLATEAAPSSLDGFIYSADESVVDDVADATDAVAREREAVDAVLRELRDVNSATPETAPTDVAPAIGEASDRQLTDVETQLEIDGSADEMPSALIDNGMVLLQASRDTDATAFDLTPVYAEQLENANSQTGMETSIGFYQAVDVAIDETLSAESTQTGDLKLELEAESQINETLPAVHETSSSRAATAIGATALTGAIAWLNRNRNPSRKSDATAQKRRASRD